MNASHGSKIPTDDAYWSGLRWIARDGRYYLFNHKGEAYRGHLKGGSCEMHLDRACEGETSRDGLWVVGGSQWRYGC